LERHDVRQEGDAVEAEAQQVRQLPQDPGDAAQPGGRRRAPGTDGLQD